MLAQHIHCLRRGAHHSVLTLQMSLALEEDAVNAVTTMETMAVERQEISRMVKCRMSTLGLPLDDYSEFRFLYSQPNSHKSDGIVWNN